MNAAAATFDGIFPKKNGTVWLTSNMNLILSNRARREYVDAPFGRRMTINSKYCSGVGGCLRFNPGEQVIQNCQNRRPTRELLKMLTTLQLRALNIDCSVSSISAALKSP
mmetsp:Transcript_4745/g.11019  ORF Transcript_4745/g.11019 Transcript_4745/m.11019 type:complete len:110 (+) Transcript_4745:676-1005(+)